MRISDWSSDVCSSDLSRSWPSKCRTAPGPANSGPAPTPPTSQSSPRTRARADAVPCTRSEHQAVRQAIVADLHVEKAAAYIAAVADPWHVGLCGGAGRYPHRRAHRHTSRSEEHPSELQSLMRISYAGFCLKKTTN